jgi:GNAT superfamily N-acetyltransferase
MTAPLDKTKLKYRLAVPEDALCLSVLFRQVYIHNYAIEGIPSDFSRFIIEQFAITKIEQKIRKQPHSMLVATYKGNLAGVAEINYQKDCPIGDLTAPELSKLYVLECFTGMGIGQQLLQNVEQQLQTKGYKELWLWVYAINERAVQFYKRQHYQWLGNAFLDLEGNQYENEVLYKQLT